MHADLEENLLLALSAARTMPRTTTLALFAALSTPATALKEQ